MGLVALIAATSAKVPSEVRAKRFVVVDDKGRPRIELGGIALNILPDVPLLTGLAIRDKSGVVRARLTVDPPSRNSHPWLVFYDQMENPRGALFIDETYGPRLVLNDLHPRPRYRHQPGVRVLLKPFEVVILNEDENVIWKAP